MKDETLARTITLMIFIGSLTSTVQFLTQEDAYANQNSNLVIAIRCKGKKSVICKRGTQFYFDGFKG
jgi:hypothetical protein